MDDDGSYTLRYWDLLGTYRMSFSHFLEIDLEFGSTLVIGDDKGTDVENDDLGTAFTFGIPILIHPTNIFGPFLGVEYRPRWRFFDKVTMATHNFALLLGYDYASIKLGYEILTNGSVAVHGPYIGFSFRL